MLIEKTIHAIDDGCEHQGIFFVLCHGLEFAPAFGFVERFHSGQSSLGGDTDFITRIVLRTNTVVYVVLVGGGSRMGIEKGI